MRYTPISGLAEVEVAGCAEGCPHEWGERIPITGGAGNAPDKPSGFQQKSKAGQSGALSQMSKASSSHGQYCQLCGGWRGSLGLEPTISMYVGHLVLICRELRRVMRDDATFWLNLGDSYSSGGRGTSTYHTEKMGEKTAKGQALGSKHTPGIADKNLLGIPWRVAFALQADGWWLRSDLIWAKGVSFCPTYSGSCMPESVRDRPTKGHEYVFLLAKSAKYYYDLEAVKEVSITPEAHKGYSPRNPYSLGASDPKGYGATRTGFANADYKTYPTRNLRSVWTINPGSYPEAHFATFPPALVEPMIKAGTSEKGKCPECGAPWKRIVEKTGKRVQHHWAPGTDQKTERAKGKHGDTSTLTTGYSHEYATTGWSPTCTCGYEVDSGALDPNTGAGIDIRKPFDPIPCLCLDPFGGVGTTGLVCERLGVDSVLIELNPTYAEMARDRIVDEAPMLNRVEIIRGVGNV